MNIKKTESNIIGYKKISIECYTWATRYTWAIAWAITFARINVVEPEILTIFVTDKPLPWNAWLSPRVVLGDINSGILLVPLNFLALMYQYRL